MSFTVSSSSSSIGRKLSKPTSFFGVKLWAAILICIALFIVLLLIVIAFYLLICCRRRPRKPSKPQFGTSSSIPVLSKTTSAALDRRLLSRNGWEIELSIESPEQQVVYSTQNSNGLESKPSDVGQSKEYTLGEIETATNGFADENVIGSGDYGVVYRGLLFDHTRVAVKKLICNSSDLKDFMVEVEAMSCVRHKNLVKLLGYCAEGTYRMLVYEYIDNGNLHHWLHGFIGQVSPLTWNMRMNIILGTVKGLVYLHEDSEPPIIHQHIKSSNILLDHQWNSKVSGFAITKLLGPGWGLSLAPPMGMSGYIGPEYGSSGILDEKSDVYSIGVVIMEIISGKPPVEYDGNEIKGYLVNWLSSMVRDQKFEQILDSKLGEKPCMKELKRVVLIALRCVDPEVENRPKMGEIIHMLEPRDLLLSDECVLKGKTSRRSTSSKD